MDLKELNSEQLTELTNKTEDKEALREIADHLEVSYSGNTGMNKLKENIHAAIAAKIEAEKANEDDEIDEDLDKNDPVAQALIQQNQALKEQQGDVHVAQVKVKYSVEEMMEMDAAQVKDDVLRKQVIKTQAMRLRRVRITNLDPADENVPGTIISVISKYTGKVAKFIPFDEEFYENGYHVPQILLDSMEAQTYNVRREKRNRNTGEVEVKTSRNRKFQIEYLRDLTKRELDDLAKDQAARNAIDRSNSN